MDTAIMLESVHWRTALRRCSPATPSHRSCNPSGRPLPSPPTPSKRPPPTRPPPPNTTFTHWLCAMSKGRRGRWARPHSPTHSAVSHRWLCIVSASGLKRTLLPPSCKPTPARTAPPATHLFQCFEWCAGSARDTGTPAWDSGESAPRDSAPAAPPPAEPALAPAPALAPERGAAPTAMTAVQVLGDVAACRALPAARTGSRRWGAKAPASRGRKM
jgi:hypothetical protein